MATVTVQLPDGSFVEGPEENLAQIQQAAPGAKVLTPDEYRTAYATQQIREEESGTIGALKSGAAGLIEGATGVPLAEAAQVAYGRITGGEEGQREAQERLRIRGEEQKAANLAGQAIGFGGAAVATLGASAELSTAARVATAGSRGIMAVGERAAETAAKQFAEDTIKQKIAAAAARGAAEGVALSAGGVAKEATEGREITGELIGTHVASGLLFGGLGGAVFSGLGIAATAAAKNAGIGTAGGLVGGTIGGLVGGPAGAVAGAATGTVAGKLLGKSASAGARAIADEAAARVATAIDDQTARVTGDLTADEIAAAIKGRADQTAAEAADVATVTGPETLETAEARLERARLMQERGDAAADDIARASEINQDGMLQRALKAQEDPNSALATAQRAAAHDADETLRQTAEAMGNYRKGTLAEVNAGTQAAHSMSTGASKARTMQRLAAGTTDADFLASAAKIRIAEEIRSLAGEVQDRMGAAGEHFTGRRTVDNQLAELERRAASLDHLTDDAAGLAEAHRIGDEAKRGFDNMTATMRGKGIDETRFVRGLQEASPANNLRAALESADIFGDKIAATQIAINDAWRDIIPSLKEFSKNFVREGLEYDTRNPFAMAKIIDDRKLFSFLSSDLATGGNNSRIDAVARYIERQKTFQNTVNRLFSEGAPAAEVARVAKGAKAASVASGQFAKARTAAAAKEAADVLSKDAVERLKISAFGSVPLIGKALATLVDLQARATIERATSVMLANTESKIAASVASFVQGGEKAGRVVAEIAVGVKPQINAAPTKPRAEPAKDLSNVPAKATRQSMAAEAAKQMAIVASVAGTPQALNAYAYAASRPMHFDSDDRLSLTLANATARATAFLNAHRVTTRIDDTLQPQLERPQLTDAQVSTWRSYVATATNPLGVLDDLNKGAVTREQAETLRTLYPAIYVAIQTKMMDALHDAKRPISYSQRVALYTLFGAATDPSLVPAAIATIQQSFAPAQAPRPRPGNVRGSFAEGLGVEQGRSARGIQ